MDLAGHLKTEAAWLEVDWSWLEPARRAAEEPPTREQVQELECIRNASQKLKQLKARPLTELVAAERRPQDAAAVGADLEVPTASGSSSSSSCALVVLTAKPGPTNADEPEMFVRALRRLLHDVPKLAEKKPALAQEAFHFQLFQLSQTFRSLRVSTSAAVKNLARPAFVWDALRAANRLGLPAKARLLNNILGDYF